MRVYLHLAPVAVALFLTLWAQPAAAADACDSIRAVTALTVDKRAQLTLACREGRPAPGDLHNLIMTLLSTGDWQVGAILPFLRIAERDEPHSQAFSKKIDDVQRIINKTLGSGGFITRLAQSDCEPLRKELDGYVQSLEAGGAAGPDRGPFRASVLLRCWPELSAQDLSEIHFVTINADSTSGISVISGTPTQYYFSEMSVGSALSYKGHQIWVAAVSTNAYSVILTDQPNLAAPRVFAQIIPGDRIYNPARERVGCITLNAQIESDDSIYLDGRKVGAEHLQSDSRVVVLPDGAHSLTVVRETAGRASEVIFDEKFMIEDDVRCTVMTLDLRQTRGVAMLGVSIEGKCPAGINTNGLRALVRSEFRRRNRQLTEFATQRALLDLATSNSVDISTNISTKGGPGPERGWEDVIKAIAHKNWRRGFDQLLFFNIRCDQFGADVRHNKLAAFLIERGRVEELADRTKEAMFEFTDSDDFDESVKTMVDWTLGETSGRFVAPAAGKGSADYFWSSPQPGEAPLVRTYATLFEAKTLSGLRRLRKFCKNRRRGSADQGVVLKMPARAELTSSAHDKPVFLDARDQSPLDDETGRDKVRAKDRFLEPSLAVLHRNGKSGDGRQIQDQEVLDTACVASGRLRGGMAWAAGGGMFAVAEREPWSDILSGVVEVGNTWRLNQIVSVGGFFRYVATRPGISTINREETDVDKSGRATIHVTDGSIASIGRRHGMNVGLAVDVSPIRNGFAPWFRGALYIAANLAPRNIRPFDLDLGAELNGGVSREMGNGILLLLALRAEAPALNDLGKQQSTESINYSKDLDFSRFDAHWTSRMRIGIVFGLGVSWGEFRRVFVDGRVNDLRRWRKPRKAPR